MAETSHVTPAPAQLHAENEIGAGPAITLLADTPRLAEKRTAESKLAPAGSARAGGAGEAGAGSPVAGLVAVVAGAGVALAAVLLCLVTAVVLGVRQRSRQRRHGDSASLGSGHSAADSEYTGECEASYLTNLFVSFFILSGLLWVPEISLPTRSNLLESLPQMH